MSLFFGDVDSSKKNFEVHNTINVTLFIGASMYRSVYYQSSEHDVYVGSQIDGVPVSCCMPTVTTSNTLRYNYTWKPIILPCIEH